MGQRRMLSCWRCGHREWLRWCRSGEPAVPLSPGGSRAVYADEQPYCLACRSLLIHSDPPHDEVSISIAKRSGGGMAIRPAVVIGGTAS